MACLLIQGWSLYIHLQPESPSPDSQNHTGGPFVRRLVSAINPQIKTVLEGLRGNPSCQHGPGLLRLDSCRL